MKRHEITMAYGKKLKSYWRGSMKRAQEICRGRERVNMQNKENNYERAVRKETKKSKKIVFNTKIEFGKESSIYDIRKKSEISEIYKVTYTFFLC